MNLSLEQKPLIPYKSEDAHKGLARIAKTLDAAVERKMMGQAQRDEILARIEVTTDFGRLAGCQVLVEAVAENRATH